MNETINAERRCKRENKRKALDRVDSATGKVLVKQLSKIFGKISNRNAARPKKSSNS